MQQQQQYPSSVTITVTPPPVTFNQGDVGSGIIASLSEIRQMEMASSWTPLPSGLPQQGWAPFPPQQQNLQQLPPVQVPIHASTGGPTDGTPSWTTLEAPQVTQPEAAHMFQAAGTFLPSNPITTQLSSSRIPLPGGWEQQGPDAQQGPAEVTATVSISARAAADSKGGLAPPDNLLSELQAQLQLRQDAAAQAGSWRSTQPPPQPQQPCIPLDELQLLLPAVHAEYKAEMKLMLRACQVASSATRHSATTGSTLLLDPASRDQLQHQVLANCNDKHAAVSAAFRQAAQAVGAAATAAGCTGGEGGLSGKLAAPAEGAGAPGAAAAAAPAGASIAWVWECLQQLRSSYQQELVAATSALFAICRGFGQRYALSPAASASIKAALAAAQRQHSRVEQLWQDVVLAAGGS